MSCAWRIRSVTQSARAMQSCAYLCSAITRSRGRRRRFVMQATRHRSGAHPDGLADPTTGWWRRGGHNESGKVGE
jgi:hypothetical protein